MRRSEVSRCGCVNGCLCEVEKRDQATRTEEFIPMAGYMGESTRSFLMLLPPYQTLSYCQHLEHTR